MVERIESVVVGGGQAGLSMSYFLSRAGREHIVLEKSSRVADTWRNRRWDSFTLVSPNWSFNLPGAEYNGSDPDGFMAKDEIVRRFEDYEHKYHLPVLYSTEVTLIEPVQIHSRYRVMTHGEEYEARNVVLATGLFHKAAIPPYADQIPAEILQLPSELYRNPQALPSGAVLVIGSAQSGSQIAEELNEAGRKVFLSTSSAGRVPRRYRGSDAFDWLTRIGFFDRTPAMLNSPKERLNANPHLSGKGGGREINLHKFSQQGIILLGHTLGYEDGKLHFAPDMKDNLAKADRFAANAIQQIEAYIEKNRLGAPEEELLNLDHGFHAPTIESLDLAKEGIGAIIWACGYSRDFSFVKLPILDSYSYPVSDQGVTRFPGLYLLGMSWMNKFKTGLLMGLAESTQHLAEIICGE